MRTVCLCVAADHVECEQRAASGVPDVRQGAHCKLFTLYFEILVIYSTVQYSNKFKQYYEVVVYFLQYSNLLYTIYYS